jgi:hypothetical protein
MVGVALARAGAAELLLTDGNADAAANCRRNLALNDVDVDTVSGGNSVQVSNASARNSHSEPAQAPKPGSHPGAVMQVIQRAWDGDWSDVSAPDVLLGADVMYDKAAFPALVTCIRQLLEREVTGDTQPPIGYFASQLRMEETMAAFEAQMAQQGLAYEVIEWEPVVRLQHLLRMEELDDVRVYKLHGSRKRVQK